MCAASTTQPVVRDNPRLNYKTYNIVRMIRVDMGCGHPSNWTLNKQKGKEKHFWSIDVFFLKNTRGIIMLMNSLKGCWTWRCNLFDFSLLLSGRWNCRRRFSKVDIGYRLIGIELPIAIDCCCCCCCYHATRRIFTSSAVILPDYFFLLYFPVSSKTKLFHP